MPQVSLSSLNLLGAFPLKPRNICKELYPFNKDVIQLGGQNIYIYNIKKPDKAITPSHYATFECNPYFIGHSKSLKLLIRFFGFISI